MKSHHRPCTPSVQPLRRIVWLAGLLVFFLSACHEAPTPKQEAPAPIVQGQQIRFAPNHPHLSLLGTSAAREISKLSVELPAKLVWNEDRTQRIYPSFYGRVTAIRADVGQLVSPGQALATLASPEFGAAQADTAKAQADLRATQKNFARQKELFSAGIIAQKDLDAAQAEAEKASAEAARAEAKTRLYGANNGGSVNQQLSLVSTIHGVVVERNLNPGQELRPDQSGAGVPPLFTISDPRSLWVQIDAREADLGSLKIGNKFEITVPSLGDQVFSGSVSAIGDFIDANTRTIKVRGLIDNPKRVLKAEMLATARITRTMPSNSVQIPASAALLFGTRHQVFVQSAAGTFAPRAVELAYEGAKDVVVAKGLSPGEIVVSENSLLLARLWRLSQDGAALSTPTGAGQQK